MAQSTVEQLDDVTIRFAGDSGDGMQLTGTQFTHTSAIFGNDISTLPDFPAEIRAPQGTLYGVSSFQLHFGSSEINTPGDAFDVLVAMNAAALKVNLSGLRSGGMVIANAEGFNRKNLRLAGYESNPLEDSTLENYKVFVVDVSRLTARALADSGLSSKEVERTKNFFALGMLYWLYGRPLEPTIRWTAEKFAKAPQIGDANVLALKAGWNYGETTEIFHVRYEVEPAKLAPGRYRNISGNLALAFGIVAAGRQSGLDVFLGSYPITPASDILHFLARLKHFGVKTFQAEDEIAAVTSAIGAAFGGALAVTSTSGPGLSLKSEAIGLAVMTELPLIVIDVQRAGPSTGMPTKVEQADLFQALYGRNSEAPVIVLAPATPAECFDIAIEAARLAVRTRTPVFILSDNYVANGTEPWLLPDIESLPQIDPDFAKPGEDFAPYRRDPQTLARPWALPGTPGLEHRIGGLEKEDVSGNVSYDPLNHEKMVRLRAEKIERLAEELPELKVEGDQDGDVLLVGWGSSYGAIREAMLRQRRIGRRVGHAHLRTLNPLPRNLGALLQKFDHVIVPELNDGQLVNILRSKYLTPALRLTKIQGLPFREQEIEQKINEVLSGESHGDKQESAVQSERMNGHE